MPVRNARKRRAKRVQRRDRKGNVIVESRGTLPTGIKLGRNRVALTGGGTVEAEAPLTWGHALGPRRWVR